MNTSNPSSENGLAHKPGSDQFLIVGIGASAGGIQALKQFFEGVPADSGMAYVVILHLSPDHDSRLAQVLQTVATIPITQVTEQVKVQPDHVYVVPPNQHLEMIDDQIVVTPNTLVEERRAPVDIFFRTLAESHRARAVAVVLSGTGANGSMGLKRIKERGGVAFVQNPREAEFNEMPRNAIATELVDEVLPVAEIPAKIIAYKESLGTIAIPVEAEARPEELQQALRDVFTQLRVRTGHDFSNYKRPTLLRRIERRINIRQLPHLPAYASFIREHPAETQALLKDLLISVTNFFRDQQAFAAIERDVLPRLFQNKREEDLIRIWVVGCATGEEAYSLAMLCAERAMDIVDAPKVQIFATDIDEAAIATAREGLYTINDAADVSPERLARFFAKEGNHFRIRREIRELVLFANHNVLKDPPFSRLDFATCRNMLIYLNQTAQERVLETLHFALNPGGYLLLGMAESVDGSGDLYAMVSREHHIFQKRQVTISRSYPVPETGPSLRPEPVRQMQPPAEGNDRPAERITYGDLHQQLLERYAPPSVVINENYDIVHLSERAGRYLQVTGGEPSQNLLTLVRPELRLELRAALYQAIQRQANVEAKNLKVQVDNQTESVNIHIRPVLRQGDPARGFLLVLFEPVTGAATDEDVVVTLGRSVAQQLEEELVSLKAQLLAALEHHEFQAEELKASNEELQAMNEELRSATEELETSKEELQSINEELTTVNQELKIRVEETSLVSNNLQNLINSTDIATIFLDRGFRVNLFSPATRTIFNLLPADFGRSLSDITHRLDYDELTHDAETVLEKLHTIEREVRTTDGRVFLMRVLPYRTGDDRINGTVFTFVDITERKRREDETLALVEQIAQQVRVFNTTLTSLSDFAYIFDRDGRFVYANQPLLDLLGITLEEIKGKNFFDLHYPPQLAARLQQQVQQALETQGIVRDEMPFTSPAGAEGFYEYIFQPVFAADGATVELVAGSTRDVTGRRRSEEALRASEEKYRTLFDSIDVGFCIIEMICDAAGRAIDYRFLESNPAFARQTGLTDATGKTIRELAPQHEEDWFEIYGEIAVTGAPRRFEKRAAQFDRWYEVYGFRVGAPEQRRVAVLFNDISERMRREQNAEFLDSVTEELARLTTADEVIQTVGAKICAFFNVLQCSFAEVNETTGEASVAYDWQSAGTAGLAGAYRISAFVTEEFRRAARAGETIAISNTQTDPRADAAACAALDLGALITVPLLRDGEWRFQLNLYDQQPRAWRTDEIELIREMATRLWARLERARAEAALQDSEERLRLASAAMRAVIYDWDIASNRVMRSDEMFNLLGFDPTDPEVATNTWFKEHVHPNDRVRALEAVRAAIKGGTDRFEQEFRLQHRDGHYLYVADSSLFQRDAAGQVVRCVGSITDITRRKQTEAALRASEERLRLLIEGVSDYAIIALDLEGRIERWNAAAEAMFGWSEAEAAGQSTELIFTPEDRAAGAAIQEMRQAQEQGRASDERWHICKDGRRIFLSGVLSPIWVGGTLSGYVKIARDLTRAQQAAEQLRESEERFRIVLESAELATWDWDLRADHVSWNDQHYYLLGLTPNNEAKPPTKFLEFVHPDDRALLLERLAEALETGVYQADFRITRADTGEMRWVTGYGRVVSVVEGQPARMTGVLGDITERKRAEEELAQIRLQLEERVAERTRELLESYKLLEAEMLERRAASERVNQLLRQIVSAQEQERQRISRELHDHLGQQLTALRLNVEALRADRGRSQAQTNETVDDLQKMIKRLDADLDFLAWELRPAALDDLGLTAAVSTFAEEWSEHFEIKTRVHTVGPEAERLPMEWETNLYRIVQESLNNVAKHAHASQVDILLERRDGVLVLIVEDNGVGFDPGEAARPQNSARGLGLIGMGERAALLGGTVEIESSPGGGTTIFVRVPPPEKKE